MKFESKYRTSHSWKCIWKCRLWNGSHFVQGEMSYIMYSTLSIMRVYILFQSHTLSGPLGWPLFPIVLILWQSWGAFSVVPKMLRYFIVSVKFYVCPDSYWMSVCLYLCVLLWYTNTKEFVHQFQSISESSGWIILPLNSKVYTPPSH